MPSFSSVTFVLAVAVSSVAGFTPYGQTFQVQVGANGNLTFDPETITANVGDTVIYNFHPKVSLAFSEVWEETLLISVEPFCYPIKLRRSVPSSCGRLLLWVCAHRQPHSCISYNVHNYYQ